MKNTFFILIALFPALLFVQTGKAQDSILFSKNKSGLNIIGDINSYEKTVEEDSNKRMVNAQCYVSPFVANWKYASSDNFTHKVLYHHPLALVRLPVAIALQKVEKELQQSGLGLMFYDAYRPYIVTEKMWSIIPDERYAANPAKGSGHNKGIAVDVSLIDLSTNAEILMPTAFDNFTDTAHSDFKQLDSVKIQNRTILKTVMEKYGFRQLQTEWWHFYFNDSAKFEILNIDFHLFKNTQGCF